MTGDDSSNLDGGGEERAGEGGVVEDVTASAGALGGLLDLGFRKSCGVKLIPLFYVLVMAAILFVTLRTSFAVMNVAVGTGLWSLIVGLGWVVVVAIGLRIVLECVVKYLRG